MLSRHSKLTAAVRRLQEEIANERERRDWVKRSCCVGLQAARAQFLRMRAELQTARAAQTRSPSSREGIADGEAASADETRYAPDLVEADRRKAEERNLRLEARVLRQELVKCKHREQNLEAGRVLQETHLRELAPRLARAKDTLGLARSAALHHKVERHTSRGLSPERLLLAWGTAAARPEAEAAGRPPASSSPASPAPAGADSAALPPRAASASPSDASAATSQPDTPPQAAELDPAATAEVGATAAATAQTQQPHQPQQQQPQQLPKLRTKPCKRLKKATSVGEGRKDAEVEAERAARERAEDKNEVLAQKVQKLQRVYAAQQMLIQRLREDLTKEESNLEQKGLQLEAELRRRHDLKGVMRQCSDDMIAAAMGLTAKFNSKQTALRRRADAPPGTSSAESSPAGNHRKLNGSLSSPLPVVAQLPPIEAKRGALVV